MHSSSTEDSWQGSGSARRGELRERCCAGLRRREGGKELEVEPIRGNARARAGTTCGRSDGELGALGKPGEREPRKEAESILENRIASLLDGCFGDN